MPVDARVRIQSGLTGHGAWTYPVELSAIGTEQELTNVIIERDRGLAIRPSDEIHDMERAAPVRESALRPGDRGECPPVRRDRARVAGPERERRDTGGVMETHGVHRSHTQARGSAVEVHEQRCRRHAI